MEGGKGFQSLPPVTTLLCTHLSVMFLNPSLNLSEPKPRVRVGEFRYTVTRRGLE